ncbi:MAG: hypothetical protein U1C55_05720 [Smithellaceae bacterium]|nr:hypothetical protein [Smithellaceae bacterium]
MNPTLTSLPSATKWSARHPGANTEALVRTALGQLAADMIVTNGRILNVYTGELLEGLSIGIKGSGIAYVGKIPVGSRGDGTQLLDAKGGTIIPGLIDGHAHLAWLYQTHEFLRHVIPRGTTTIITETMEAFPIMGYEGVLELLGSFSRQPIKIFATAPAMVSISKKVLGISPEILAKFSGGKTSSAWVNPIGRESSRNQSASCRFFPRPSAAANSWRVTQRAPGEKN